MASLFTWPQILAGSGISPEDGLKLFFFDDGTSTPKNTFTTEALNIANSNPVISDANGVFPEIWMAEGDRYKVELKNKNDILVGFGTVDPYIAFVSTPFTLSITVFGQTLIDAADADAARIIMNSMKKVSTAVTDNLMTFDSSDEAQDSGVQLQREQNAGGTADALTATFSPILPSPLIDKVQVKVRALFANATTTPTFEGDTIVKEGNQPLAIGDIFGPGHILIMDYNLANTNWELLNPANTIGNIVFTKEYASGNNTITAGGSLVLSHGLGEMPRLVQPLLVCTTAEGGYIIGDNVLINPAGNDPGSTSVRGMGVTPRVVDVFVRFGTDANTFTIFRKDTGALFSITNANWALIMRAWA